MKALINASFKVLGPLVLDGIHPGLGRLADLASSYFDEQGAENIKQLIIELKNRVYSFDERIANVESTQTAAAIQEVIRLAAKERVKEKIGFYAGLIAGELLSVQFDWEIELREQLNEAIVGLAGPEVVILYAMYQRNRGEAISVPQSKGGGNWLSPVIHWNDSTVAWIDSLIRKGLVFDASIELMQTGFGSPGPNSVKSRSSIGLSTFARTMIDYMLQVQEIKGI